MHTNKLIAIGAILLGIFMAYSGLKDKKTVETVEASGTTVPATIEGGQIQSHKGVKSFKLDVRYRPKTGAQILKTFTAPRAYVEKHVNLDASTITDGKAEVRYLPTDPREAILVGATGKPIMMVYSGIAVAVAGLVATVYFFTKVTAS